MVNVPRLLSFVGEPVGVSAFARRHVALGKFVSRFVS